MKIMACSFLFVAALSGQWWPPAVNLGIPGFDDINPQACRRQADHTALVWQNFSGGNWEIYTRFHRAIGWGDTVRVTNNTVDDCYPSIAYDTGRHCFWCAWQKDTAGFWNIYVIRSDSLNHWLTPVRLPTGTGDNERPSVFVIGSQAWVVWQNNSTPPVDIMASYYNGAAWSAPMPVTQDSIYDNILPKIGDHNSHPFAVWQRNQDIYYSEYSGTAWSAPQAVTSDAAVDSLPELTNPSLVGGNGTVIFWQSDRNGNWDVYRTGNDSFNVNIRMTMNPADDFEPSPLNYVALTMRGFSDFAHTTNRNGNDDIYVWDTFFVDTAYSVDNNPVMTGGDLYINILWQSNRNGDWDIYGTRSYVGGVEEQSSQNDRLSYRIYPNPFRDRIYFSKELKAKGQKLYIYDIKGRLVCSFNLCPMPSALCWSGTDQTGRAVPPGVYFAVLRTDEGILTEKVIRLR